MKIEIPILITILGAAITFGGFYYSTSHRLGALETQIESIDKRINKLKRLKNNRN